MLDHSICHAVNIHTNRKQKEYAALLVSVELSDIDNNFDENDDDERVGNCHGQYSRSKRREFKYKTAYRLIYRHLLSHLPLFGDKQYERFF